MTTIARMQSALDLTAHIPPLRRLIAGQLLDLVADWTALVALLVLAWQLTGDVRVAALVILARLLPRLVLPAVGDFSATGGRGLALMAAIRAAAVGLLAIADDSADLFWGLPLVLTASAISVGVDNARARAIPAVVPRMRIGSANGMSWVVCRLAFVVGPLLGAALVAFVSPRAALLAAAGLLAVAAALAIAVRPVDAMTRDRGRRPYADGLRYIRSQPMLVLAAGALFVGGVVAVSLQLALVVMLADTFNRSHAALGLLFAATGAGMLLGPLPIPRLLVRIPSALLLVGNTLVVAAVLPFTRLHGSLAVLAGTLLIVGIIGVTNDLLVTTLARRSAPPTLLASVGRLLVLAATAGQLTAALGIVLFADGWTGQAGMLLVALCCGALVVALLLRADVRGLLANLRPQSDSRA